MSGEHAYLLLGNTRVMKRHDNASLNDSHRTHDVSFQICQISRTIVLFFTDSRGKRFPLFFPQGGSAEEVRPDTLPRLQDGETKHDTTETAIVTPLPGGVLPDWISRDVIISEWSTPKITSGWVWMYTHVKRKDIIDPERMPGFCEQVCDSPGRQRRCYIKAFLESALEGNLAEGTWRMCARAGNPLFALREQK